jgi:DNA-binding beta-propeller fold protein YncE
MFARIPRGSIARAMVCGVASVLSAGVAVAGDSGIVPCPIGRTFTTTEDFVAGQIVNLTTNTGGRLEVNPQASPLPFLWVAASARGTIIKINTESGQILGEYRSAPDGLGRNPSRTTVDLNGAVWAGNRDEDGGGMGSVVQIALAECCCEDRNGNGVIDTSTGLGDIRPWTNAGGADTMGGVSTAEDECIAKFVRVESDFVRHVSVDGNNNIWVGGNFGPSNRFNLLDNATGAIIASFDVGAGGYGGLVDDTGVLWSANRGPGPLTVLRYDTKNTLATDDDTWSLLDAGNAYGLAADSSGQIWNAQYDWDQVRKFSPSGALLGAFPTGGGSGDRGVAVTSADDDVWVANSFANTVTRLSNSGVVRAVIDLGPDGSGPTGVAVDAAGKVWATCLNSSTAKRIDPNGGADGLGAVDLTVNLGAGAGPYNYSDMTGSALVSVTAQGNWTVVHDGGVDGGRWLAIAWNTEACADPAEPKGTSIVVQVRAADTSAGLLAVPYTTVANGENLSGVVGRFIQVRATLDGVPNPFTTPVLCDLSIRAGCQTIGDLDCDGFVGASDLAILLPLWGSSAPAAADIVPDGVVDARDLAVLLGAWGACGG